MAITDVKPGRDLERVGDRALRKVLREEALLPWKRSVILGEAKRAPLPLHATVLNALDGLLRL